MAGGSANQKIKLLYLMKILYEKTDENNYLTMNDIIEELSAYGVDAERKSVYSDIETLKLYGVDIAGIKENRNYYYYIASRRFELAELKLLVDSVSSSKFITSAKSKELIRKIESLASRGEAKELQRQVYVSDRIKTENESIFYNVDYIHKAISMGQKISFQYFNWDVNKKRAFRRDGERYLLSPWALLWNNENYYLVAYDSESDSIKHFRVDKMLHINIEDEKREGQKSFKDIDLAAYSKSVFGMFGGKLTNVKLLCDNDMAGVVVDRFGKDLIMIPEDNEHFTVRINVAVSRQFFGWIVGLSGKVKIVEPAEVVDSMKETLNIALKQYT